MRITVERSYPRTVQAKTGGSSGLIANHIDQRFSTGWLSDGVTEIAGFNIEMNFVRTASGLGSGYGSIVLRKCGARKENHDKKGSHLSPQLLTIVSCWTPAVEFSLVKCC